MAWKGEEAKARMKQLLAERLERAAITLKNECKLALSEPSPPPSAPGEAPHKDTGRGRASVAHEVDKDALEARVGSNVDYMKFLELGTKNMAARPWLAPTYRKHLARLKRMMKGS